MSYNIPFAHNIALKIALDFASEILGSPYSVYLNGEIYTSTVEDLSVVPVDSNIGAEIYVNCKFREIPNRIKILNAGLGKKPLTEYLQENEMFEFFIEKYGIIFSTAEPTSLDEFDIIENN